MITKQIFLKIKELHDLGLSGRKISEKLGYSNTMIERYVRMDDDEFDRILASCKSVKMQYEAYRTAIIDILTKHPEASPTGIKNRLSVMFEDFKCNRNTFSKYIQQIRDETGIVLPERRGTQKYNAHHSLRETPPAGYEAEVDFGEKIVKDMYGKSRRIYMFSMVLTYSNLLFGYFSPEPFTTALAIEAHRKAFEFFGGRTKTILYDNDVVFTKGHNFGEPLLTKEFESFIDEIGFGARFCKARVPESKGTVEVGIKSLKSFLDARTYSGIDSLNSELLEWLDRTQNAKKSVAKGISAHEAFADEAPAMIKVPKYRREQTIFVACGDNQVRYQHNVYELPMYKAYKGTRIKVTDEGETVAFQLADNDEFLCRHNKCKDQGKRIALPDRDATAGRSSLESLLLRYRGNKDFIKYAERGRQKNPRYIIALSQRILKSGKYIPEDVIFDAVRYINKTEKYTVREYMSYLEYRGFGGMAHKFYDRDREHFKKRAVEIAEELANE